MIQDQNSDPNQLGQEKVITQQREEIVRLKSLLRQEEGQEEEQAVSQPHVQVNKNLSSSTNKRMMVRKRDGTSELKGVVI